MSMLARAALLFLLSIGLVRLSAAESDEVASLRLKAERGNALAQYNLGLAYAQGRQVPTDPAEAFAWLTLASENGATGKALDSLLGNISDAQLSDGRRRLATYRGAVTTQVVEIKTHTPKLAPRGFTVETTPPPVVPPATPSTTSITKAPEAVSPPITTSPADGAGPAELAQTRKDLEKAQVDLVTATTELSTLQARVKSLEDEAAAAKANEARLTAELKTAQQELAALKPVATLPPAEKSKAESSAPNKP